MLSPIRCLFTVFRSPFTDGKRTTVNGERQPLPLRPEYFLTDYDRYKWLVGCETRGGVLDQEDAAFKQQYETRMNDAEREHWQMVRELGNGA